MSIKQVLKTKYGSWSELEKEIEKIKDTTEKGDAFEQVPSLDKGTQAMQSIC